MTVWFYLDDERIPSRYFFNKRFAVPGDVVHIFRDGDDMLEYIIQNKIQDYSVSFDNDLGDGHREGHKILKDMFDKISFDVICKPKLVRIHTNNPIAAEEMVKTIESFNKFFGSDIEMFKCFNLEITETEEYLNSKRDEFKIFVH